MSGFVGGGGSFGGKAMAWDPTVTGIAAAQLRDARGRATAAVHALRGAPDLRGTAARAGAAPGVSAGGLRQCADWLDECEAEARALVDELDRLHDATMLAGRAYEWASDAVRDLIEQVAGGVAYTLGTALRTAALMAAPWAVAIGLVAVPLAARLLLMHPHAFFRMLGDAGHAGGQILRFLEDTSQFWERAGETLMANPLFAAGLKLAVESTDEALAGLLGVPLPVADLIESKVGDDEIFGFVALAAAGGAGLLTGGGRVQVGRSRPIPPPARPVDNGADAMRVIAAQEEQVTIHEHRMPDGSTRYQVFVRGTQSVLPSSETGLDMQANLENAGSLDNLPGLDGLHGSDAAVAEAMRRAGIGPGDAVDLFGFSQGAAAVANVAASGEFDVETALLVGGPVGAADIPPEVAVFSVAHRGDIVPSLDGRPDEGGPHTTLVESAGGHGSGPLARHAGLEYIDTLDHLDDFMYDDYSARISAATTGAVVVSAVSVQLRRR